MFSKLTENVASSPAAWLPVGRVAVLVGDREQRMVTIVLDQEGEDRVAHVCVAAHAHRERARRALVQHVGAGAVLLEPGVEDLQATVARALLVSSVAVAVPRA